jgi:hypothetical protein
MTAWPSTRAKQVLAALLRIGWTVLILRRDTNVLILVNHVIISKLWVANDLVEADRLVH